MFWFPQPDLVAPQVQQFLQFEIDWLQGSWNLSKVLMLMLVPVSFLLLGLAFWNRSLWMGLAVLILMATGLQAGPGLPLLYLLFAGCWCAASWCMLVSGAWKNADPQPETGRHLPHTFIVS
jgi:hypothetical protein